MGKSLGNIELSERHQSEKTHILWLRLYERSGLSRFRETRSRSAVAQDRGVGLCGGKKWEVTARGCLSGVMECSNIRLWRWWCTAQYIYLKILNYTLRMGASYGMWVSRRLFKVNIAALPGCWAFLLFIFFAHLCLLQWASVSSCQKKGSYQFKWLVLGKVAS